MGNVDLMSISTDIEIPEEVERFVVKGNAQIMALSKDLNNPEMKM